MANSTNILDYLARGLESALPATAPPINSNAGAIYLATDSGVLYFWNDTEWVAITAPGAGITELTGAVLAGPGSGSVAAFLPPSGVTPGTYTNPTLIIDDSGLVTDAVDGTPTSAAPGYSPGFVTGQYYSSPTTGALTSRTATANLITFSPFYVPETTTFQTASINVIAGVAGASVDIGIYASANAQPGALLNALGTLSAATPGAKELTSLSLLLGEGWYWLTSWPSHNITNVVHLGSSGASAIPNGGFPTRNSAQAPTAAYTRTLAYSAGNLPNPAGTIAATINSPLAVFLSL